MKNRLVAGLMFLVAPFSLATPSMPTLDELKRQFGDEYDAASRVPTIEGVRFVAENAPAPGKNPRARLTPRELERFREIAQYTLRVCPGYVNPQIDQYALPQTWTGHYHRSFRVDRGSDRVEICRLRPLSDVCFQIHLDGRIEPKATKSTPNLREQIFGDHPVSRGWNDYEVSISDSEISVRLEQEIDFWAKKLKLRK